MITSRRRMRPGAAVVVGFQLAIFPNLIAAESASLLSAESLAAALIEPRLTQMQQSYGARLAELQKLYDETLHTLHEQHGQLSELQEQNDQLRDLMAALPPSCDDPGAGSGRRHLAGAPDVTDYVGISVRRDDSFLAMGVDSDVLLVRSGPDQLAVVADNVAFHSSAVCLDGDAGCLVVSADGELLFDGDSLSSGAGLNNSFVNKSIVGRQCASVDVSSVVDGCVPSLSPPLPRAHQRPLLLISALRTMCS